MQNIARNSNGMILMVSLWILALISLLSLGLAHRVIVNQKLVGFGKDKIKTLYIAKAAIRKAEEVIKSDYSDTDILSDLWSTGYDKDTQSYIFKDIEVGDGSFTIKYIYDNSDPSSPKYFYGLIDEDRKININSAPVEILTALFNDIGLENPEELAGAICYWRGDGDKGVTDPYYGSSEVPYGPRLAPLKTIEELSLIKGFREKPEYINKCKDYITVYTNSEVNINTASEKVLKAIFKGLGADAASQDFSTRIADYIIDYRNGPDNIDGTQDDVAIKKDQLKQLLTDKFIMTSETLWLNNQSFFFTDKSDLFRIEVSVKLDNSRAKKNVIAIYDRSKSHEYPLLVYWHEE